MTTKTTTPKIILTRYVFVHFHQFPHIPAYYDVLIKVNTWKCEGGVESYEVQYGFIFHNNVSKRPNDDEILNKREFHPLYSDDFPDGKLPETPDARNAYCGKIVANTFTSEMVSLLLMDNESLSLVSGIMSYNQYRKSLMQALSYFAYE